MSTRLIHFTQHTIFWECAELCASEFEPEKTEIGGLQTLSIMLPPTKGQEVTAEMKHAIMFEWVRIVADYTERKLTVVTDKFPAISAIAERVALLTGDSYIAGLWKSRLFDDLLWTGLWKFPEYRKRPYTYPQESPGLEKDSTWPQRGLGPLSSGRPHTIWSGPLIDAWREWCQYRPT